MKRASVNVEGLSQLGQGAHELFERIEEEAPKRFLGIAEDVEHEVAARVPRVSGALAASVTSFREREQASVGLGEGLPYAGWIEFGGTRGRPYVPHGRYLFPVALHRDDELEDQGEDAARDEIRRMHWKRPR